MEYKKIVNKDGTVKYRHRYYTNGRGSKKAQKTFDSKDALLDFFASQRAEKKKVAQGCLVQTFEETTIGKEIEFWLSIKKNSFSPGHLKRVRGILDWFLPKYGKFPPSHFTSEQLYKIQSALSGDDVTSATVNRKLEVITAVLNFSAENRRIPYYPAAGFCKLDENRGDIEFFEREEAEKFLSFAEKKYPFGSKDRWKYVAYLVSLNTAIRAGELWGLMPKDLKKEGHVLHIQRQFDRVVLDYRLPKGKKPRFVPCNELVKKELQALIRRGNIALDKTIFQNEKGKPICHDNFAKRVFKSDVLESGVTELSPHCLRHTGTTLMLADGLDIKTVKEICGHQDIDTTMEYAHLLANSVKKASQTFSVRPNETKPSHLHLIVNHD